MRIVNIQGGLGNQMFQYAFARSLQKRFPNEEVKVTTHYFNSYHTFPLEAPVLFPAVALPHASYCEAWKLTRYSRSFRIYGWFRNNLKARKSEFVEPNAHIFYPEVYERPNSTFYEGYWQHIQYLAPLRDELRTLFTFPEPDEYNRQMAAQIESCNAAALHIRRGDYLTLSAAMGVVGVDYYKQAIALLKAEQPDVHFFVFSNDQQWCQQTFGELIGDSPLTFVTGNTREKSPWDMFLMSRCRHIAMGNSSFSWWAAFLNPKMETVFAPSPWAPDTPADAMVLPSYRLLPSGIVLKS